MSIYSDTVNGILLLRPSQDVDFEAGKEIQERLTLAENDDVAYVIIDFALAALVSAAALQIVLAAADRFRNRHGCIVITGARVQLRSLLVISSAQKLVPAFATITEAQEHLLTLMGESDAFPDIDDI